APLSRTAQPRAPATTAKARNRQAAIANAVFFRLANFRKRYDADGGQARTGSSARYRWMSSAKPLAVSNRRLRSFWSAFITIQSRSPRTSWCSLRGSVFRRAAIEASDVVGTLGAPSGAMARGTNLSVGARRLLSSLSLVLGLGGSSSRIIR